MEYIPTFMTSSSVSKPRNHRILPAIGEAPSDGMWQLQKKASGRTESYATKHHEAQFCQTKLTMQRDTTRLELKYDRSESR